MKQPCLSLCCALQVTFVSPPAVHRRSATETELYAGLRQCESWAAVWLTLAAAPPCWSRGSSSLDHIEQLGEIGKHVRDALEGYARALAVRSEWLLMPR